MLARQQPPLPYGDHFIENSQSLSDAYRPRLRLGRILPGRTTLRARAISLYIILLFIVYIIVPVLFHFCFRFVSVLVSYRNQNFIGRRLFVAFAFGNFNETALFKPISAVDNRLLRHLEINAYSFRGELKGVPPRHPVTFLKQEKVEQYVVGLHNLAFKLLPETIDKFYVVHR